VAEETRRRVLQVVNELNYRRDPNARRLAGGRSDLFGLIVSEIANPFFADVIRGFEVAAMGRGFDVVLCHTEYQPRRVEDAVRKMVENKVRGVAILTSMFDTALTAQLAADIIPAVLLGSGEAGPGISQIEFGSHGLTEAIDHLLELGHQHIAFVSGPENVISAVRIRDLFLKSMAERGRYPCRVTHSNYKLDGGMSAVRALLAERPFPTAIVCGNDLIALGVISALEEAGISVPEDISVVGHDDILLARLARPPLTTVQVPQERLGKLAFEALQKMLRTKRGAGKRYVLETNLVVRKSTAPRRREDPGVEFTGT
jgi:LacI family transcriptional regulator